MRLRTPLAALSAACLVVSVSACDPNYSPGSRHASSDASTGSMLHGTDTGAGSNGLSDPGIRNMNQSGTASGG